MGYILVIIGLLLIIGGVISIIYHLINYIIDSIKKFKKVKSMRAVVLKEIQTHRKDLLKKIDHNINIFKKLKNGYDKWYEFGLDVFRRTPNKLNKEKAELKEHMDNYLNLLDSNINDLLNCKNKSNSEIEQTLYKSEKDLKGSDQKLDIIQSDLEDFSSKWEFLTDEDKHNLGILRKI